MTNSRINVGRWLLPLLLVMSFSVSTMAKRIIIGGGHIGIMNALIADQKGEIEVDIYTKNAAVTESTAGNIWNSHTSNEMKSVIPSSSEMPAKLSIRFDEGGILAPDIKKALTEPSAQRFINAVKKFGADKKTQDLIDDMLSEMGAKGMSLWKAFSDNANPNLGSKLKEANFNPCCDSDGARCGQLYQGYRIDLMYGFLDPQKNADELIAELQKAGYKYSSTLAPDEVIQRDPSLTKFVESHSTGQSPHRRWDDNTIAVWRPGGCLDTERFLPNGITYLKSNMKERFNIHYNKEVVTVNFANHSSGELVITGLGFKDGAGISFENPEDIRFDFIPGESVGTLEKLGFDESPYAGFAGCSLKLEVDISHRPELLEKYKNFKHHMEVHKPGIVLAWQARNRDGKLFIGGAGTKAFYGPIEPKPGDMFTSNNLKQLQMFRDVLPDIVALALDVAVEKLPEQMTQQHLDTLVETGKATRWVGRRSLRYNGMPSVGFVYHKGKKVRNGTTITHAGSGGGSFSIILNVLNNYAFDPEKYREDIIALGWTEEYANELLKMTDSRLEP